MSERYTKLFSLERNLFAEGSPLIVCGGSLLYDSITKNYLAQLKYKNIGLKTLKALKICLSLYDGSGTALEQPVIYSYQDLNVPRDAEFGRNHAVILPQDSVRSFSVKVLELVFEDGEKWPGGDKEWKSVGEFQTLEESYQDEELASQYRVRYGLDCKYKPRQYGELWLCTCGAINRSSERSCHQCRRVFSALMEVNTASLKQECSERLKAEQEQALEQQEENLLKKKKRTKLALLLIPLCFVLLLLSAFVPGAIKRSHTYSEAAALLSRGEFQQAQQSYEALGDYKDSALMASKGVPYRLACSLMDYARKGDELGLKLISRPRSSLAEDENISEVLYEAAGDMFKALGDYEDSPAKALQCAKALQELNNSELEQAYSEAGELLSQGKFCLARDAYAALGSYRDSGELAKEAIYQKALSLYAFMESHDFRRLYAMLSTDTEVPSRLFIAQEEALKQGENYITELKAALGRDSADIDIKEQDEDLLPMPDALSALFAQLGDYKDSAAYIESIASLTDYTGLFFRLVNEGRLPEARQWLTEYEDEFPDREHWMSLLELYIPYCGTWLLNSGDPALVSDSAGLAIPSEALSASVRIEEEKITLMLSFGDSGEGYVELSTSPGDSAFYLSYEGGYTYCAALNVFGRLAYSKYDANGSSLSSCDYSLSA